VKIAEAAPRVGRSPTGPGGTPGAGDEARTRDRVRRGVLEHGPVTASELADLLGLTPAAVRRHLDGLAGAGLIAEGHAPDAPRGRGRPARHFVLTAAGHAAGATGYDDLAVAALTYLQESGGNAAVRRFADARVSEWESRYRDVVEAAGADSTRRAEALAAALTDDGYAATTRPVEVGDPTSEAGITSLGTQLCQGHCPVQRVAAQFPQLCEAEAEAFGRLLGVHVQRLATLAHGEHVCTTHVPHGPANQPTHESSSHQQSQQSQNQERTTR
jgi:predicted ArsR family transcriptional regulator